MADFAVRQFNASPQGRQAPSNPLFRLFFELERTTLGPIAGAAEELVSRQNPNIVPTPILEAMKDGFQQAKTFDNIIENPWLAFALNVGLDPITWIPGAWTVKGAKLISRTGKGALRVTGLPKTRFAQTVTRNFDGAQNFFGT